jgi:hypothetical protein
VQYVVRFDRPGTSTGPDAVVLTAERYGEAYHEGHLVAYLFFDEEGREVAMVRSAHVVYIAVAGTAIEPAAPPSPDELVEWPEANLSKPPQPGEE